MAQGAPQGTPETVVYVSNAGSKEVFVLAMNRATGALELIEKTPVPGTDKPSPASLPMATSPDKHFLYAQLRSEPYPVSTFAIDRTTGRLRHLAATPLVDQMAYINTDRTGKFLLAASYVGAKLAIYPINAQSVVEAKATQILDTKPKAHCVVIDAGNKNVYVPVLGGDIVMELKFDPAAGTVSPNGPGEVATKAGAGPRHLTFHPNGKFASLITETTATIGTYAVHEVQELPKHDRWRARHKNVHFHFTPTHASWLNQVEVWFSILSSQALAGASFTSPRQVREQIDAFIAAYNQDAHPFEWTKQVVFSQHPRSSYADLRN